jgi:pimeloyl-CoA synthetase
MDLRETVPSVCSETGLTHSADGIEVCDIKVEEVLETQEEEDPLAVAVPAIKAEHEVRAG